jgi:hypothetical protein
MIRAFDDRRNASMTFARVGFTSNVLFTLLLTVFF